MNKKLFKIQQQIESDLKTKNAFRCGCDICVTSSSTDSLRYSQARINAYRALSASSLIALSSKDPLLTAFELSWELRKLSRMESEFRSEYEVQQNPPPRYNVSGYRKLRTK